MAQFVVLESQEMLRSMTDIDFRRLASLLFTLRLLGVAEDPIKEAVKTADKLLEELQRNE